MWYFLAPLYPLVGVVLLALPISVVGLFLRASLGLGAVVAGLVWVLVLLASLAAMWLLGGLIFGWPLMWPTISAEQDGATLFLVPPDNCASAMAAADTDMRLVRADTLHSAIESIEKFAADPDATLPTCPGGAA